jgi:hypothetical protein
MGRGRRELCEEETLENKMCLGETRTYRRKEIGGSFRRTACSSFMAYLTSLAKAVHFVIMDINPSKIFLTTTLET